VLTYTEKEETYERMIFLPNGYIIVRASAADGAVPVQGALVTVYAADGENSNILATRTTDSGGKTDKISLPAPPRALSETPDDGGVRPYAIYNIDVSKVGYYDSFNSEVPVFDGITSVLPVVMIPLSEYNSEDVRPDPGLNVTDREPPLEGGNS
jgi:hypothetical protein